MKALRGLNKEQWATAGAGALAVLLLLFGFAGGAGAAGEAPPRGGEMIYERPGQRYLELPSDKFEQYWKKKIFIIQEAAKLPPPVLRAPEPAEEDLPAPLFRPAPAYDAYNRLSSGVKYPALVPGAALVDAAMLPPQAELDALRKLEEPEAKSRPDRRGEREREFYTVKLRTGRRVEGEFIADTGDGIMIKDRTNNARVTYKKADIGEILTNRTFAEVHQQESPKLKTAEERLKHAQKLVEWGMLPEAAEELRRALELRKDLAEASRLLAQVVFDLGNLDAALDVCLEHDLHYEAARCLKAFKFQEGVLYQLELAIQSNPRHAAAKIGLARALVEAGRPAEAVAVADDFFLKLGRSPETTNEQRAEAHLVRALAQLRMGAIEKAKPDLDEAVKVDPNQAEAMNAKGAVLALEGAWQAAGSEFAKAIRANQYLTDAWTNLATLCLLAGKAPEAEALFAAAAQRDPESADALAGQGLALHLAGKDPKPLLERALQGDPRHAGAHVALGHLKLKAGQDEEALSHFTAALRTEYFFLPAYSGAASAFLRTARKPGVDGTVDRRVNAETLLRQLKDFDADRPRGWVGLGCVLAILGRADEARQALRMALNRYQAQNKPVEPIVLYALGWIEFQYGAGNDKERMESSLREFQQAAALKAQAKDAFSLSVVAAAESAVEAIENWKASSLVIVEPFNGPDGKTVSPHWLEAEGKYGLDISLEKGRAKISGKQSVADFGVTQLSRDFAGEDFHALEITFYPEQTAKAEYGVSLYYNQQGDSRIGFHVGVDAQGKVRFHGTAADPRDMDRKEMAFGGWAEVKVPMPNPKEFRLRLTRGEKNRAQNLTLWFWDAAKADWIVAHREIPANLTQKGTWRVGVFCRAMKEQDVTLYVDDVRVYARERR